jgi:hypothetical protein
VWSFDDESLHEVDAHLSNGLERSLILDLLGHDLKIQGTRQLDHCGNHRPIHAVGLQVANIGTVDFQIVDSEILQVGERTNTAAKVIQCESTADPMQNVDKAMGVIEITDDRRLGNLEAELRGRNAGVIQRFNNKF